MVYTDPQAAAVGADVGRFSGTVPLAEVAKTATYTRAYADSNGFLTLLSDGERLTGAYALGPEAGEWLQQATLAIRAHVPLDVLSDTIQPFPTFSEIYVAALKELRSRDRGGAGPGRIRPTDGELQGGSVAGIARANGRADRRQRRHRPRDRPACPQRGRRSDPRRPRSRAARAGRPRGRRAQHRCLRRQRRAGAASDSSTTSPGPIDHVLVTGRRPSLRAAGRDGRRRGAAAALDEHVVLRSRGRAQRGAEGAAGRHAAVHGRHRRATDQPRARRSSRPGPRRCRPRGEPRAGDRPDPGQPDRRRLRRHAPVGLAARRRTRGAARAAPRHAARSGGWSDRRTSRRSPST